MDWCGGGGPRRRRPDAAALAPAGAAAAEVFEPTHAQVAGEHEIVPRHTDIVEQVIVEIGEVRELAAAGRRVKKIGEKTGHGGTVLVWETGGVFVGRLVMSAR